MPAKLKLNKKPTPRGKKREKLEIVKPMSEREPLSVDGDALLKQVSGRLRQLLDKHSDTFGSGRGQTTAFARALNTSHGTAVRFLSGQSLPPALVLIALSRMLGVSVDWLLGISDTGMESALTSTQRYVDFFDPTSPSSDGGKITVAGSIMPAGLDTASLVVCRMLGATTRHEDVIVRRQSNPVDGRLHAVFQPASGGLYLRKVVASPSTGDFLLLDPNSGETERLAPETYETATLDRAGNKLSIVGPVVARIAYTP